MKPPIDLGAQPNIRTARLWLSPFVPADAPAVFAYASNPDVSKHATWRMHQSIEDAERFIRMVQAYESEFCWAIRRMQDGAAVGAVEFGLTDPATGSIHYVLAQELWNQGLMTESIRAVLRWAFEAFPELQLVRTAATSANIGSCRVLEKCGFEFSQHVLEKWEKFPEPVELASYLLVRRRWEEGNVRTEA